MTATTSVTADGLAAPADSAGPPYDFTTELIGQFRFIPLKDVAMLTKTQHGYVFRTGQQDSHLVVTRVRRGIRLVDTGTKSFKRLSPACQRRNVRRGIAAVCRVPAGVSRRQPLLVEVWPRLGNDFTDGSSLPATIAMTVLGDEGRDVARFGAGPDFFNGHFGGDRVSGGSGNDWIRAGHGNDAFTGGPGHDRLVGMEGRDLMFGARGDDRVGGGDGNDRLRAGAGEDFVLCGTGRDSANVGTGDRVLRDCEAVNRR
jgi:serralysin